MKKRDNRLKKNSGGFTLIELIVTVAIIAIFSGVILSFIGTGSNTYRSTSSNAKVQMETQEVVDRMEDLIIDANRSVYYANGTGAAMGSAISDDIDGGASTGNKTFIVCNEYKNNDGKTSRYICDVIDWNRRFTTASENMMLHPAKMTAEFRMQIPRRKNLRIQNQVSLRCQMKVFLTTVQQRIQGVIFQQQSEIRNRPSISPSLQQES